MTLLAMQIKVSVYRHEILFENTYLVVGSISFHEQFVNVRNISCIFIVLIS